MKILKNIGIDYKDRKIIQGLYQNQKAIIEIRNSEVKEVKIQNRVRQGRKFITYAIQYMYM